MLQADEYMLPYGNLVGSDPSIEDMHKVLIKQGARPDIPARWKHDNVSINLKLIHFSFLFLLYVIEFLY